MSRRTGLAAVAMATAAIVAVAACGGSGGVARVEPHATVPTAPPTTADPYAIPATIDAAYVNRVLEGLDAAVGDIVRLVISTRVISPEVIDRLNALYLNRDDVNLELQSLQDEMRRNFSGFKDNPGNKKSDVAKMLSVASGCIFVEVSRDYSAISTKAGLPPSIEWIGLKPADPSTDRNHYNPTPWMVASEGFLSDGSQPPSPCADSPRP